MAAKASSQNKTAVGVLNKDQTVRKLYRKILSRDPSPAEIKAAVSYLDSATIEQFAQVLLATNEEVFWP